jgi:sulfite exporter TauE/SafE
MNQELQVLLATAASLGFLHTLFGPDHYLPFVVMSRAQGWSAARTAAITFLCGLGHVLSSVLLGFAGIALGSAITSLEAIEAYRGDLAAWILIVFGLLYLIWGLRRGLLKKNGHTHLHPGQSHAHFEDHAHSRTKSDMRPWVLFTIFVLGPCEPLIPILIYPAARGTLGDVFLVAGIFSAVTIATMMASVLLLRAGVLALPLQRMDKYIHALAGGTILACGLSIRFLGL